MNTLAERANNQSGAVEVGSLGIWWPAMVTAGLDASHRFLSLIGEGMTANRQSAQAITLNMIKLNQLLSVLALQQFLRVAASTFSIRSAAANEKADNPAQETPQNSTSAELQKRPKSAHARVKKNGKPGAHTLASRRAHARRSQSRAATAA